MLPLVSLRSLTTGRARPDDLAVRRRGGVLSGRAGRPSALCVRNRCQEEAEQPSTQHASSTRQLVSQYRNALVFTLGLSIQGVLDIPASHAAQTVEEQAGVPVASILIGVGGLALGINAWLTEQNSGQEPLNLGDSQRLGSTKLNKPSAGESASERPLNGEGVATPVAIQYELPVKPTSIPSASKPEEPIASTPEERAAEAQQWINDWRVDNIYREFYEAVGTVRIQRAKASKVFKFGDFLAMKDEKAKQELIQKI